MLQSCQTRAPYGLWRHPGERNTPRSESGVKNTRALISDCLTVCYSHTRTSLFNFTIYEHFFEMTVVLGALWEKKSNFTQLSISTAQQVLTGIVCKQLRNVKVIVNLTYFHIFKCAFTHNMFLRSVCVFPLHASDCVATRALRFWRGGSSYLRD